MSEKALKSVDISSFTIISTGITTLISILISIILVASISLTVPDSFSIMIYIIPTIVFGTIISSIFIYFSEAYLYNIISKKLGFIKLDIGNEGYIKKISNKETGLIIGTITLIMILVIYLAFSLILPLMLSSLITTMMYASQNALAYVLYQYIFLISNPLTIVIGILGTTIIVSVFTLIATYIYNLLAGSDRGIIVKLEKEDKFNILDSIDAKSFAIAVGAISLILNLIVGLIMIVSGAYAFPTLAVILMSFFVALIEALIIAVFYNFLAPRIGKLKFELE